jgi:hypothetical protein
MANVNSLKYWIGAAVAKVDEYFSLHGEKLEYRLDILRVTNGAHIDCI